MKLSLLAAILVLAPAGRAFADLGTAPTDPLPALSATGPGAAVSSAKSDLYREIEAWRATQLPHLDPPAPLTVRLEPRLDEIKGEVTDAADDAALQKPREELEAWKKDLLRQKYDLARKEGLTHGNLAAYSSEQTQQAQFSAALRAYIAQDAARRSMASVQQESLTGMSNPSGFFDGGTMRVDDPSVVSAGAPVDPKNPARYSKVRQILISQGASSRVVDMAIQEAIRQNADPLLVLSVINAESGFDTHATSYRRDKKGRLILDANGKKIPMARGLMQIMAATGRGLGVRDSGMLYDAQTNLKAGITFLKGLWGQFVGGSMTAIAGMNPSGSKSVASAVAAYNAGPGAVAKYNGVPPYRETQGYVKNVLGYYAHLKQYMLA